MAPAPYKRIATEESFSIPEVLNAMAKLHEAQPARFSATIQATQSFPPDRTAIWMERLVDLGDPRIADMDASGIDMQLLLLAFSGVQEFEAGQALELSKLVNDRLADAQARHPDRLAGLAVIPPQDPQAAAQELERAVGKLGLHGLVINSHTDGETLDLPKYWPIFEAMSALDVPLYLHPREPIPGVVDAVLPYALEGPVWGYAAEAGLHAMRLIFSGLFDELPDLKIVLGHAGENIPAMLWRIDNRYEIDDAPVRGRRKLKRRPSDYFRENFAVTSSGVYNPETLRLCRDVLGADNVLFAVDYPFEENRRAMDVLATLDFSPEDTARFYETNARRIFGL